MWSGSQKSAGDFGLVMTNCHKKADKHICQEKEKWLRAA
jgi:hypothetical protein